MLRFLRTRSACLAPIILTLAMGLNGCGEETMTIPRSLIYSFDHKVPRKINRAGKFENYDLSSDELKPFMDNGILFLGNAIGDPNANTFDIGVQFYTETDGRKVFVEKLYLDTPNLKTERIVNDFIKIDRFGKSTKLYFKRFEPFENISGDSIPLTADCFMLSVYYNFDDGPTKQMSIRFDNASFLAPIL